MCYLVQKKESGFKIHGLPKYKINNFIKSVKSDLDTYK